MTAYTVWCIIFFCIGYLIVTDQSIAKLFYLGFQLLKIQFQKAIWWIKYSPDNPIVRYLIYRNSIKIADELRKELDNKR